jgi:hypothetical protein
MNTCARPAAGPALFAGLLALTVCFPAAAWDPVAVANDPLVRMPGTQPGQVTLEGPHRCLNCHAGYNQAVEPGFNWKGSMMAQAARDFLFYACMTVAAQDSIWAIGTPNAVDICERCHFPKGWLEGRSDPANASLMTGADFDGVQCDLCHQMYDPFLEAAHAGLREGADWQAYWDESNASDTPSQPAVDLTLQEDRALAATIERFDGSDFFGPDGQGGLIPPPEYTENGSGQYFVSGGGQKRASFSDAAARHQMFYSRYHKSRYFCSACHDVSNPALANLGASPVGGLPTESVSAHAYYHVERTFSEFMLSAYGKDGGAAGIGPFAPEVFETSLANDYIARCQDCHMRDVVGAGANKNGVPIRPGGSAEHPLSGQPLHDLTGGNVWVATVLASAVPGSLNHDATNEGLLWQGPDVLTLDLSAGEGLDPEALLAGADRALQQLQLAAAIEDLSYGPSSGVLSFRVQNQTGHKLISGFPEGRRMFVNVRAYVGDSLVYEVNPYDETQDTLKGLPGGVPLGPNEAHVDELVYEMHPSSTLTGEDETFHFVLADGRYKDNRIPPKGFDIAAAGARLSVPAWHGVEDPNYFTPEEYAGGYDQVDLTIAAGADRVEVNLYYQTTSREYVEFLRDEIANGVAQSDPFFDRLRAWGDTLWQLWDHNKDLPGAAPVLMAQATYGTAGACDAPVPTLIAAVPGNQQVTLEWSDETSAGAVSYAVYLDQEGKTQLVEAELAGTGYTHTDLTNGQQYCYVVTASNTTCESAPSNTLCAVPNNQGQAQTGVATLETGTYSGKGKHLTWTASDTFSAGDSVVLRAHVVDSSTGLPLANASVDLAITGPESLALSAGPSDSDGIAEATWNTQAPNKRGQGGTATGTYSATVTGVTADGYTWDGAVITRDLTLQ